MSFSDAQFAAAWTILKDRWARKHNAQTVKIYRDILTAEQFGEACRAAFRFETFFRSPQKRVDYCVGKGDFQERAISEWDEAIARVSHGLTSTETPGPVRDLIRSVCNGEPLGHLDTRTLTFARREFLERRTAQLAGLARNSTPALPGTFTEVARVSSDRHIGPPVTFPELSRVAPHGIRAHEGRDVPPDVSVRVRRLPESHDLQNVLRRKSAAGMDMTQFASHGQDVIAARHSTIVAGRVGCGPVSV